MARGGESGGASAGQGRGVVRLLRECLKDSRGQAVTEYVVVMGMVAGVCYYLYHPDNPMYRAFRERYDRVTKCLVLPAP